MVLKNEITHKMTASCDVRPCRVGEGINLKPAGPNSQEWETS